eukprot:UN10162
MRKIETCLEKAREKAKQRDKKSALFQLKKKKQYEKQLSSMQGKKLILETQIMTLEDCHLSSGSCCRQNMARRTFTSTGVEYQDSVMDDINEAMDQVQEMEQAMMEPLRPLSDDELERELAELEDMEAMEVIEDIEDIELPLPHTGSTMSNDKSKTEDDELAELEAMM